MSLMIFLSFIYEFVKQIFFIQEGFFMSREKGFSHWLKLILLEYFYCNLVITRLYYPVQGLLESRFLRKVLIY